MAMNKQSHQYTNSVIGIVVTLLISALVPAGAKASEPSDNLPSGSFITLRQVPTRAAELPAPPAPPNYVVMGGRDEVVSAVDLGLTPLTDSEQSAVLARTTPMYQQFSQATTQGLDVMADRHGMDSRSIAQEQAGSAGGIVRDNMGALSSALGVMRDVLGGGK